MVRCTNRRFGLLPIIANFGRSRVGAKPLAATRSRPFFDNLEILDARTGINRRDAGHNPPRASENVHLQGRAIPVHSRTSAFEPSGYRIQVIALITAAIIPTNPASSDKVLTIPPRLREEKESSTPSSTNQIAMIARISPATAPVVKLNTAATRASIDGIVNFAFGDVTACSSMLGP